MDWGDGQPSADTVDTNCLLLVPDPSVNLTKWYDNDCPQLHRYICEQEVIQMKEV